MIREKNSNRIFVPGLDGPLVSFGLFNELQHNILQPEVAENSYKDYKSKFENKRYQSFFNEHQNDEWFKEKYDFESNTKWRAERNTQSNKLAENFFEELNRGVFRGLILELRENDESGSNIKITNYVYDKEKAEFEDRDRESIHSNNIYKGDSNIDIARSPYFGFDPDRMTLFLHQVPRNVSRWDILELIKPLSGFMMLSFSEPIKNQNFVRYCWVTFDNEENLDAAYEALSDQKINPDYRLNPIKSKSTTIKRIRVNPPQFDDRTAEDLDLSKSLITIFDKDKEIEVIQSLTFKNNTLLNTSGSRSISEQLDLQIIYLRRVHGYCYYCVEEYEDERLLSTRCDNSHLRCIRSLGSRKEYNAETVTNEEVEYDMNFTKLVAARIAKGSTTLSRVKIRKD